MKTVLHVHNVTSIGGPCGFIVDFAEAYSQFHHMAISVRQDQELAPGVQMLNDAGIRSLATSLLTPSIVDSLQPDLVILHNTSGNSLEGKHPWDWIHQWPTISWHHSPVRPMVPADYHVFVSEYVRSRYLKLIPDHIKKWVVIPPCIRTRLFKPAPRPKVPVIGKISTPSNPSKYPPQMLEMAARNAWRLLAPGAAQLYGNLPWAGWLDSPEPNWWSVPKWLNQMSVFVYLNDPVMEAETWCRAVTEAMAAGLPVVAENRGGIAEQIQNFQSGILVTPGDWEEAEAAIRLILKNTQLADKLGAAARERACTIADISVLRSKLDSVLLGLL